jgi:hypothetical protein
LSISCGGAGKTKPLTAEFAKNIRRERGEERCKPHIYRSNCLTPIASAGIEFFPPLCGGGRELSSRHAEAGSTKLITAEDRENIGTVRGEGLGG